MSWIYTNSNSSNNPLKYINVLLDKLTLVLTQTFLWVVNTVVLNRRRPSKESFPSPLPSVTVVPVVCEITLTTVTSFRVSRLVSVYKIFTESFPCFFLVRVTLSHWVDSDTSRRILDSLVLFIVYNRYLDYLSCILGFFFCSGYQNLPYEFFLSTVHSFQDNSRSLCMNKRSSTGIGSTRVHKKTMSGESLEQHYY
jgi:hypothetical protein